jgi:multidrug transporter EmrE-like cation transporter
MLSTLGIMISTTSPIHSLSDLFISLAFYVWVALPFIVLIALAFYIHRKGRSPASRVAILLTLTSVTVLSLLAYLGFNLQV